MQILQDLVDRLETTHTCYHPTIANRTISHDSLYTLACAVLQIHNTTTDEATKATASTALKAIEGLT